MRVKPVNIYLQASKRGNEVSQFPEPPDSPQNSTFLPENMVPPWWQQPPPAAPPPNPGEGEGWRLRLGQLSFERRGGSPARSFAPWPSWRRRRSLRGRLIRYGIIAVVVIAAVQVLGSQFSWLHLPHISLAGPTQTSITNVGPVIRDRLEGISNPAPAVASYEFNFKIQKTRKLIGFYVVGYADTYYVSGEGYSHVLLNPGKAYWQQNPDAFNLTVTKKPATGANGNVSPGHINLVVTLPEPNLPRGVGSVRLDPASGSVDGAAHWIGCPFHVECPTAALANVHFTPQLEQQIAFEKLACDAGRDHKLAAIARQEAYSTIYGWLAKFSQALHYNLSMSISWTQQGSNESQPLPKYCGTVAGSTVTLPS